LWSTHIDIETPSPRHLVSEGTTNEWSEHRSDSVRGSSVTQKCWTLFWCSNETEHGEDANSKTRTTHTRDCTTYDQGGWIARCCTYLGPRQQAEQDEDG